MPKDRHRTHSIFEFPKFGEIGTIDLPDHVGTLKRIKNLLVLHMLVVECGKEIEDFAEIMSEEVVVQSTSSRYIQSNREKCSRGL